MTLEHVYWLVGAFLLVAAFVNARSKRWTAAAFWAVLAIAFVFGDAILQAGEDGVRWPAQAMGLGVVALGLLAGRGATRKPAGSERNDDDARAKASAARLGNRLFVPALAIPLLTLAFVLGAKYLRWGDTPLIDPAYATLIGLGIACVLALLIAMRTTRASLPEALGEGTRLLDTLGSVAVLPMLLATLGSVFAATGVGDAIAALVGAVIPIDNRLACLAAFAFGMVLFTVVMGNAFAAFR